jgi:hypothetical protein
VQGSSLAVGGIGALGVAIVMGDEVAASSESVDCRTIKSGCCYVHRRTALAIGGLALICKTPSFLLPSSYLFLSPYIRQFLSTHPHGRSRERVLIAAICRLMGHK